MSESTPSTAGFSGRSMAAPLAGICAIAIILAAGFRIFSLPQVQSGGFSAALSFSVLFFVLFALGLALLIGKGQIRSKTGIAVCALLLGLALLLRICCLDHATADYQDFLAQWAQFFRENGGIAALSQPIGDYNVPYLYFLAGISYTGLSDLYLIKLFSILFEVLTAWGVFLLTRQILEEKTGPGLLSPQFVSLAPAVAFFLTLFLPTVFFNGAVWGQCDSIYTAFAVFAVYAALRHRGAEAVMLIALAFSFKLQAIFLLPLFLVFVFTKHVKWYQLFLFPLTYCVICLPALLLGRPFLDIFSIYSDQASSYPYLSLNAPTLATWLPADADVIFWGNLCISAAAVFLIVLLSFAFLRRHSMGSRSLIVLALLMAVCVPLLLPRMHERYFYLAEVLSVVWACSRSDRAFLPALIQTATLSGYHAYLTLQYVYPLKYGALLLCLSLPVLIFDLFQQSSITYRPLREEAPPLGPVDLTNPNEAGVDLSIIAELADSPYAPEEEPADLSADLPPALQMDRPNQE